MKLNFNPLTNAGTGVSVPVPADTRVNPINIAANVYGTGTPGYTLQYTLDDVYAPGYNAATGNWYPWPSTATTVVVFGVFELTLTATAVRINITANTGTINVQFWQNNASGGGA